MTVTPTLLDPRCTAQTADCDGAWLTAASHFHQSNMTSSPPHIKTSVSLESPTPHPLPSRLPPYVTDHIIWNDSHPEPLPGEKTLEVFRQPSVSVYVLLKNRLVHWSLEQTHTPKPSLLIRGWHSSQVDHNRKSTGGESILPPKSTLRCVSVRACVFDS